jgi:hypothetical protein
MTPDPDHETDHDILLKLKNDMGWLKVGFADHLKYHWAILLACFGTILSLSVSLIYMIIKMVK